MTSDTEKKERLIMLFVSVPEDELGEAELSGLMDWLGEREVERRLRDPMVIREEISAAFTETCSAAVPAWFPRDRVRFAATEDIISMCWTWTVGVDETRVPVFETALVAADLFAASPLTQTRTVERLTLAFRIPDLSLWRNMDRHTIPIPDGQERIRGYMEQVADGLRRHFAR